MKWVQGYGKDFGGTKYLLNLLILKIVPVV